MKTYIRFLMTFSFVMSLYYIAINFVGIRSGTESVRDIFIGSIWIYVFIGTSWMLKRRL